MPIIQTASPTGKIVTGARRVWERDINAGRVNVLFSRWCVSIGVFENTFEAFIKEIEEIL